MTVGDPATRATPDPDSGRLPGATDDTGDLAVVLSGGGARAAYQAGVLRFLARAFPELRIPIITGVSAGSINAALLAQHHGTLLQATEELASLWRELTPDRVFRVDLPRLLRNLGRWGLQFARRPGTATRARGLVDTEPLRTLLEEVFSPVDGELTGIDYNLHRDSLRAVAIGTTSYTTGQTVIWIQGRDVQTWERPQRRSVRSRLRLEHVLASASLPLFFPAVRIGEHWYGDGGIGLTAPLAPAVHLGAHRILAISTRHTRGFAEADVPHVRGYPPPAQVIGVLYDAVFLDAINQDIGRMERINQLVRRLPPERRGGMRVIELLVIRPSREPAELAGRCEPRLPGALRLLTRGLGTRETQRPELLSMLMFQTDYARMLIRLGEEDAERQADRIAAFLGSDAATAPAASGIARPNRAGC